MSDFPGALSSGIGADLSSGTTIVPTNCLHNVTGTSAVVNITTPTGILPGQMLILIPKGIFTWTAAGNILKAGTAVVGKALWFIWDGSKWAPSYTA